MKIPSPSYGLAEILIITFLIQPASANGNACYGVFESSNLSYVSRIELVGSPVFSAERYASELAKMDRLLFPLLSPSETRYQIIENETLQINSFNDKLNLVKVTGLTTNNNSKDSSFNNELAYLYHENGHAIFETNMRVQNPDYRKVVEFSHKGKEAQIQRLSNQIDLLKEQISTLSSSEKEKEAQLTQKIKTLIAEIEMVSNTTSAIFWRKVLHEVFADIVAVTTSKDPSFISKAEPARSTNNGGFQDAFSDFTREFLKTTPDNLAKWKMALKKDIFPNAHYWILPVRWAFWDAVNTRIENPEYQKQVLPKVFKILSEEFSYGKDYFESSHVEKIHNHNFIPKEFFEEATARISERFRNELSK